MNVSKNTIVIKTVNLYMDALMFVSFFDKITKFRVLFKNMTYTLSGCTDNYFSQKLFPVPTDTLSNPIWTIQMRADRFVVTCNGIQVILLQYDTLNRTKFPLCFTKEYTMYLYAIKFELPDNSTMSFTTLQSKCSSKFRTPCFTHPVSRMFAVAAQ